VPVETDLSVARMKLSKTSVTIDMLTEDQKEYLGV
jgi:S-adenosylhomocysteine hydrolase